MTQETTKPVVHFAGDAQFEDWGGNTVAYVHAIDHPYLGSMPVRTSSVQKRHDDGSFETLNTIYKPELTKTEGAADAS